MQLLLSVNGNTVAVYCLLLSPALRFEFSLSEISFTRMLERVYFHEACPAAPPPTLLAVTIYFKQNWLDSPSA